MECSSRQSNNQSEHSNADGPIMNRPTVEYVERIGRDMLCGEPPPELPHAWARRG